MTMIIDQDLKHDPDAHQVQDLSLVPEHTANYIPNHDAATAAEEAALVRKLDWRLLPFVLLLYTLSILDRSNIGNAKLAGMNKDLHLSSLQYAWLGTLFYIAYILFQFMTLGWKQFPPHIWAACVVMLWGFIATVQAASFNWAGLMTCRFFLGVAEASFGPGVPLYLTYFYPRDKVGFRHGVFISGSALANVYGSILAYGITQIKGSLAPWKILFLIEGLPTCIIAVFVFFFLPDSIEKAKFLSPREKEVATRMVARNQTVDTGDKKTGLNVTELLQAFKDPKSYLPAIMYFSVNVSFASLPLFVPTIVSEIGTFTTVQAQGLSAPPYALCFFVILGVCWMTDKFRIKGPFITAAALVAAVGFILLATCKSPVARYIGVFLAVEVFVCVAILLSWVSSIHSTESKRTGGYVILQAIGQCGPLLGTNIFPASEKPYYRKGMWISTAFCLLLAVCSVVLHLWLRYENKVMEREGILAGEFEGQIRDARDGEKAGYDGGVGFGGDGREKRFRYIL